MKPATISSGGQLSIPAEIRHRWGVTRVLLDDLGDAIMVRPLPEDPIGAARGSLPRRGMNAERARAESRREDAAGESHDTPPR